MEKEFTKEEVLNGIYYDDGYEYDFMWELAWDREAHHFVTVPSAVVGLVDTRCLNQVADQIRRDKGDKPMYPHKDEAGDMNGWYNFCLMLNRVDLFIVFTVCNTDAEDNEFEYEFRLTPDTQKLVYEALDASLKKHGLSCEKLLTEAENELKEDIQNA